MSANYWIRLAPPFYEFTLATGNAESARAAGQRWADAILRTGHDVLTEAVDGTSNLGNDLRNRVQALQALRKRMALRRKEWKDE